MTFIFIQPKTELLSSRKKGKQHAAKKESVWNIESTAAYIYIVAGIVGIQKKQIFFFRHVLLTTMRFERNESSVIESFDE
jgi:hypothetical protein